MTIEQSFMISAFILMITAFIIVFIIKPLGVISVLRRDELRRTQQDIYDAQQETQKKKDYEDYKAETLRLAKKIKGPHTYPHDVDLNPRKTRDNKTAH